MWRGIKKIIHDHRRFLITTHVNPDGDGLGAGCALIDLLRRMGKEVQLVCDSPIPERFSFLDFHKAFIEYRDETKLENPEVFIILDTHRKERIGRLEAIVDRPEVITLCIDHHVPTEFFTKHMVIDPHSCSVGAMVYTLYKECGFELNLEAATGIYASVFCDTGRFSYSSTSRKAHKIADECIKLGVDPDLMYSRLYQHLPVAQIRIFAKALQGMELYYAGRVVVQQIMRGDCENGAAGGIDIETIDLDYLHEFNKWIENVECTVILHELPNHQIRVSLRSKPHLDILPIVKFFGGGGHSQAAGALCSEELSDVKQKILNDLKKLFSISDISNNPEFK